MTFFKSFLSKNARNAEGLGAGPKNNAGLEEPVSPADFKDEKRDSDVQSITESAREELATVVDPTLNPGALTFEEGTLFCLLLECRLSRVTST